MGIYNGTILYWDDPSLVEANPGVDLPNSGIRVVARADTSGTTEIFTSALCLFDSNWNETYGNFNEGIIFNSVICCQRRPIIVCVKVSQFSRTIGMH